MWFVVIVILVLVALAVWAVRSPLLRVRRGGRGLGQHSSEGQGNPYDSNGPGSVM